MAQISFKKFGHPWFRTIHKPIMSALHFFTAWKKLQAALILQFSCTHILFFYDKGGFHRTFYCCFASFIMFFRVTWKSVVMKMVDESDILTEPQVVCVVKDIIIYIFNRHIVFLC